MFGLKLACQNQDTLTNHSNEITSEKSYILNRSYIRFFADILLFLLLLVALLAGAYFRKNTDRGGTNEVKQEPLYTEFDFKLQPKTSEPLADAEIESVLSKIPRVSEVDCSVFLVSPDRWNSTFDNLSQIIPAAERTPTIYNDCDTITSDWIHLPVSEFERRHPIAYSIMVYNNLNRFVRLLKAVYRTSNVYCVHVDSNASPEFKDAVSNITSCFDNVFTSEVSIEVRWGTQSVLQQEMICLRELWQRKVHWEWAINLTGEEFPLKTNLELVHILSILRGFNDVWVDPCTHGAVNTTTRACRESTMTGFKDRWETSPEPPYFVHPYKGQVHFVLSRSMVDFVLHSNVARTIYNWTLSTLVADELFFSTLNANVHVNAPGSKAAYPVIDYTSLARLKLWRFNRQDEWKHCDRYMRLICLLSPRELPLLTTSKQLFANKFKPEHRPVGYACLEDWYFTKVVRELKEGRTQLDLRPYHRIYYQYLGL